MGLISSSEADSPGNSNLFLEHCSRHQDLWGALFKPGEGDKTTSVLCCPESQSLSYSGVDKGLLKSHILIPMKNVDGHFRSLDGKHLYLSGDQLCPGNGYHENGKSSNHKVRIISTADLSLPRKDGSGQEGTVKIYYISHPLTGGLSSPTEDDEIGMSLNRKYVSLLRSYPEIDAIFLELEDFIRQVNILGWETGLDGYNRIKPFMSASLHSEWQTVSERLCNAACLEDGNSSLQLTKMHISQIVETYMMYHVGKNIYAWLTKKNAAKSERLSNLMKNEMQILSPEEIGIPPAFQCCQEAAVFELMKMKSVQDTSWAPVEKIFILRNVVNIVQKNVSEFVKFICDAGNGNGIEKEEDGFDLTTDDLIAILCQVVIQASPDYENLYTDIQYLSEYHFVPSISSTSLGFNLCHFQCVLSWFLKKLKESSEIEN